VTNITNQKTDKFSANKLFRVKTHKSTPDLCELFLRREKGNYFIYALGKNGEARANVDI